MVRLVSFCVATPKLPTRSTEHCEIRVATLSPRRRKLPESVANSGKRNAFEIKALALLANGSKRGKITK